MKVLLIGIDGATFSVLNPLFEAGVMPYLKSLSQRGVRAKLRTIIPALTPPAWTSLMTGRSPGVHGVFDFFRFESETDRHIRFGNSRDVQCQTIWELASNQGKRVVTLNFPLMFPPPKINGVVVPGWVPWKVLRLACHPPELFDDLKELPHFNPRELAMDIKLEEKATEGCTEEEVEPWVQLHIRRERNWLELARHLFAREEWDLASVLFDGVDKLQHLCWRFIDPAYADQLSEDWEFRIRDLCLDYYRQLDGIIESLVGDAPPDTTVLIASDHGFGPTEQVFHVNSWLEEKGYLRWSEDGGAEESDALLGVGKVARHTYSMDWRRTKAFAPTPTSNGIHIVAQSADDPGGVPAHEYESFRARLIGELREVRDDSGSLVVSRIWTREQAFDGPMKNLAPDVTLELTDGGLVSILPSDRIVRTRPRLGGAHRPCGVFFAGGPRIEQGRILDELSILEVAPTVLHCLGLAVPEDFESRVPEQIFRPDALASQPVRTGQAASKPTGIPSSEEPAELGPEDNEAILERMRQLGYIE